MDMKDCKRASYYGDDEVRQLSYLEFGSIDYVNSKKEIWGYCQDQKAYDYYMFSRYADDLFLFRKFFEESDKSVDKLSDYVINSAHNKLLDYIFKYAGFLTIFEKKLRGSICESGSSLYGLIDEVMACDYVYHGGENIEAIQKTRYICSDISEMMNQGAKEFHSNFNFEVSTAETIGLLMDKIDDLAMFYGLSVSMRYALRTASDLIKIANRTKLSIFNRLSFSLGDTIQSTVGTGKYVYIISLQEFGKLLKEAGFVAKYCSANMQFNKDVENTLRVSFVMAENVDLLETFIKHYEYCVEKSVHIKGVEQGTWFDFDNLLSEYKLES